MPDYTKEIERRRTFAIISHPDAGKTTLTEKFLLYGGAINLAGSVKGKATARHAVSDWMEIEKERGISVTSSVLQFNYDGYCINILDTPGHQDFSEDTYRTLMAADSAVMVIDASKGVEAQTRKLFKVCVMRHIPIFTFINKMDRDANDTFELLDEIEKELGIATCPINWPIGSGKKFRGVYDCGVIDPVKEDFSAFVFNIQANMNKAHRDRIAFMRICSGKFDAGMEVFHVQGGKKMRLSQPQQMMASDRHIVDEAYAGDIIGVFDPGIFSIGDTICMPGKKFAYEGIPTFAPEHFARVRQLDTMKRKQFVKGISQIAQEGAIQIFQEYKGGMEEIIVGVVGVLQFDVLKYRLENEYNVDIRLENLPYEHIRWIANKEEINLDRIQGTSDMKKVMDLKGNPLLLFVNPWSVGMVQDRNKDLVLTEFSKN